MADHLNIFSGKDYTKSFIDPEKALVVFNHYPLASLEGAWTSHEVMNQYKVMNLYKAMTDFNY